MIRKIILQVIFDFVIVSHFEEFVIDVVEDIALESFDRHGVLRKMIHDEIHLAPAGLAGLREDRLPRQIQQSQEEAPRNRRANETILLARIVLCPRSAWLSRSKDEEKKRLQAIE